MRVGECGGGRCEGVLDGTHRGTQPRWRYYDEHVIELGVLDLSRTGWQELTLEALHIPLHNPTQRDPGIRLAEMRLIPV